MEFGVLVIRKNNGKAGEPFVLRRGGNAIGRDSSVDVPLDDDSVSRVHARILCSPERCVIRDNRSTHGTTVNGEPLEPDAERVLRNGDRIGIGPYTLIYVLSKPVAPQPARPRATTQPRPPGARPRMRKLLLKPPSSYMQLLPHIYHDDDLVNGLLLICESILSPLDRMIGQLHYYSDPHVAPEALLPWLAEWVDLRLDENWPIERQRTLVGMAAELYRWRGTRHGMATLIQLYTGAEPAICEPGERMPGEQQALPDHVFGVVVDGANGAVDEALLCRIIEAQKPAHTSYRLVITGTPAR